MIKAQLSQIERKAFGDMSLMNFKIFYMWLAAAMFLLLMAENFIPESLPAGKAERKIAA